MNEKIKCVNNNCSDCQKWLKENLAKCEDWEVKRKESYRKFEFRFCGTNSGNQIQYSETGGTSYLACPHGCGKASMKKNNFGDELELEHECSALNQIKSNQIKWNQIKSNQIKSNQIKSNQMSTSTQNSNKNYLPWILGGIAGLGLIGIVVYFATKKGENK